MNINDTDKLIHQNKRFAYDFSRPMLLYLKLLIINYLMNKSNLKRPEYTLIIYVVFLDIFLNFGTFIKTYELGFFLGIFCIFYLELEFLFRLIIIIIFVYFYFILKI